MILLDGDGLALQLIKVLDQNALFYREMRLFFRSASRRCSWRSHPMQRGVIDVLVKPLNAVRLDAALRTL